MLNQRGRPMGIEFVYHEGSRVFNTFNCHKLMAAAALNSVEQQNHLQEILFRKYFKEGKDLGQESELVAAATEAKMIEADAKAALQPDHPLGQAVKKELSHVRVNGVPHFYFPNGRELSGGQPIEVFAEELRRAASSTA